MAVPGQRIVRLVGRAEVLLAGFAALGALSDETLVGLWLVCRARPPHRRPWDGLRHLGSTRHLLTRAERLGLLPPRGARYEFASGAVRDHLIGLEQAVIDANAEQALERKRRVEGSKERRAARKSRYAQAAAGAVDLVNQTRFLQENGAGPCDGCARPESGNDNGGPGHPDEPPVESAP